MSTEKTQTQCPAVNHDGYQCQGALGHTWHDVHFDVAGAYWTDESDETRKRAAQASTTVFEAWWASSSSMDYGSAKEMMRAAYDLGLDTRGTDR